MTKPRKRDGYHLWVHVSGRITLHWYTTLAAATHEMQQQRVKHSDSPKILMLATHDMMPVYVERVNMDGSTQVFKAING